MPGTVRRTVRLAGPIDLDGFRLACRRLLHAQVDPADVVWRTVDDDAGELFGDEADDGVDGVGGVGQRSSAISQASTSAPATDEDAPAVSAPAFFVELCGKVVLHRDAGRFALLYRMLWRLRREPALRHDPLDPDRLEADRMAHAVRRDQHKMKAFVRFRPIGASVGPLPDTPSAPSGFDADADDLEDEAADAPPVPVEAFVGAGREGANTDARRDECGASRTGDDGALPAEPGDLRHVAWFEPDHHIVEAVAPFFARRFTQMRWAILTPERSVRWNGRALAFGPGARREDAPPADAGEQLWLTYYENIFNPARLKLAMMRREMPTRYWRNLPEATLISGLAATASQRSTSMVEKAPTEPARRRPKAATPMELNQPVPIVERPGSLDDLGQALDRCRECPIGALATQAVPGEGPTRARLMFVGEQPGDQEDLRGKPFVGPAGQLLDRAFGELGWPRDKAYVTNAVKHFKFELRGKRRIHKTPAQQEAAACLHWLEREIELVQPEALVALGATAARQLVGRAVAVMRERGSWIERADGRRVLITLHPSALLRTEPSERAAAYAAWLQDLHQADALFAPHRRAEG